MVLLIGSSTLSKPDFEAKQTREERSLILKLNKLGKKDANLSTTVSEYFDWALNPN